VNTLQERCGARAEELACMLPGAIVASCVCVGACETLPPKDAVQVMEFTTPCKA